MGLYREVMYSNAPVLKYKNAFYGDYEKYNGLQVPSTKQIAQYQKKKLMEFQAQAFKNDAKTKLINEFLHLNGVIATSSDDLDKIVYEKMNNIFININQLIKEGYMSTKKREELKSNQRLEAEIVEKLKDLGKKLDSLRSEANMVINSSYINQLNDIINSLPFNDIDVVLRTLFHLKGDILEEVGTEWFNKKIPVDLNVKAISTGAIRGKKGQQLIQDLLVIDMDNIDLMNTPIAFKMGKQSYELPLKDFIQKIENNKGEIGITIENEGEKLLQSISLLGIQAKSGINQLPWNKTSLNTQVSILGDRNALDVYCQFLRDMEKLRYSINWDGEKNIKKESSVYTAMANLELAKSLSKVLHLSQIHNQYVLTPNGFMPFVSRILELYEYRKGDIETNTYFSFGGKIQLTSQQDILTKERPVILGV